MDGGVIDEVETVARIQKLRDYSRADQAIPCLI
jgi:hypothetical protein